MKRSTLALLFFLLPAAAWSQTSIRGIPPFGSLEQDVFDSTNRYSLNTNFSIPLYSGSGRGVGLNVSATYNSAFWQIKSAAWVANTGGATTGGWVYGSGIFSPTGYYTKVQGTNGTCGVMGHQVPNAQFSQFVYYEPNGTAHPIPSISYTVSSCNGSVTGTTSGSANDGSGFYLNATPSGIVYGPDGTQITSPTKIEDSNGNYISYSNTTSSWTDSAGRSALKIVSGTSSVQYEYQDTTGTYQSVTVNLQSLNIKTNFACSGISEFTGTATLPISVVYPNGTQYLIAYEGTPGNSGYYTGRVSKLTLPNGGYIQYQYGSTNDGINCADGTIVSLTRTAYDGTNTNIWQFSRSPSGSNWVTTVTAPVMPYDTAANQSVFTFNPSGQEVSQNLYQGSSGSGTLLRTINTTWASNSTPATQVTILEDNSTQSEVETNYDSNGNLLSQKEHDYGTGAPGAVVRTTTNTYLNSSAYVSANIVDRITETSLADSSGTTQYVEDTVYDGGPLSPCPTGGAQHDDAVYTCTFVTRGNPTSTTTYTNAAAKTGAVTKNKYYDIFGNLAQVDDDAYQTFTKHFSSNTNYASPDYVLRGVANGTHLTTNYTFNPYTGQLASIVDPNNQTTSFAYDFMRRLNTTTRPDLAQVVQSYDDTHHTQSFSAPIQGSSVRTQTDYQDGLSRTIQTTVFDASGSSYETTSVQYDGLGRSYEASNPYVTTPQYWTVSAFDALGRPIKETLQDNQQSTYSYSGAFTTTTDPVGHQRKYKSDGLGRIVIVFEPDPTNNNSLTLQTSYSYSVLDQLSMISQGAQTRTYIHDGMGRLASQTLPESGTTSYQYNSFNLISQRTDARGVITTYTYDTINRPYQVTYNVGTTGVPSTPTLTYAFGTNASQYNNGRLLTVTDGLGTVTYAYDNLVRRTQAQHVINGSTYTINYSYNSAGEVTALTYPSSRIVQHTYDSIGRLSTLSSGSTTYSSSFSYNPSFRATSFEYGNGVSASIGYSADRLQLQSIAYNGGSTIYSATYGRTQNGGNNGQITSITDNVDSGRSVAYVYDSLNRLASAVTTGSTNYPKWGLSFTYDRYGNRTAQTVTAGTAPANSVTVSTTTNQITTPGYSYDANGNITNDGYNTITYDAENRIVSVVNGSGSASYSYRASGHRVLKLSGGVTTTYLFDQERNIADYTNGILSNEYVYHGREPVATHSGTTLYFHLFDNQSIRTHLDSNKNIVGQRGQYPFGEDWYTSNIGNRHFSSYIRDSESTNDYGTSRYVVNRLGRRPTIGGGGRSESPQTLNRYSYIEDDPININTGTISLDDCGGGDPDQGGGIPIWCPPAPDPCGEDCIPGGGGHGGGGGGGCGESPCPPPPPPTGPFPGDPTVCRAEMKFRPVKYTFGLANHAFWFLHTPDGKQQTISAGPNKGRLETVLDLAKLNVRPFDADIPRQPDAFDSGESDSNCWQINEMTYIRDAYPKNVVPYDAFFGPNSNSFAYTLGLYSTFDPPKPPRVPGWGIDVWNLFPHP